MRQKQGQEKIDRTITAGDPPVICLRDRIKQINKFFSSPSSFLSFQQSEKKAIEGAIANEGRSGAWVMDEKRERERERAPKRNRRDGGDASGRMDRQDAYLSASLQKN